MGKADPAGESAGGGALFRDIAAETGLDFVHFAGISGEYYYNEMMGSGAALADVDGDGDLDIYLVQGRMQGEGKQPSEALFPPQDPTRLTDRLFRNDLEVLPNGERHLRFTDVTEESGLRSAGYGMGAATGDVDNDGDVDFYVTNFGANQLWLNDGRGHFRDGTADAGAGDQRWSTSATFLDFDRDGWLDLWVVNYLDFSLADPKRCTTELGGPNYCGPLSFAPQGDALYRNRGNGTFEDVSGRMGLTAATTGAGLGVVAADFDQDDLVDIYVGNDGTPNHLWKQRPEGGFQEAALLAGVAVNGAGQPEASMGIDAGDVDGDGDEDLFLTHLAKETNTLYLNDGSGLFEDASAASGLGSPSWESTSFGTAFFDYDNDGHLDVLVVNGAVKVIEELALAGDPLPLHQPNQLFHNRGDGTFEEVSGNAGAVFRLSEVSRGAAFGDLDNDGDVDVLLINNSGPARLLENLLYSQGTSSDGDGDGTGKTAWLGIRAVTPASAGGTRDALGAEVLLEVAASASGSGKSGDQLFRRVSTGGSYASAGDPRLVFGLGSGSVEGSSEAPAASYRATVRWPDDDSKVAGLPSLERFEGLAPGGYRTLLRGAGTPLAAGP